MTEVCPIARHAPPPPFGPPCAGSRACRHHHRRAADQHPHRRHHQPPRLAHRAPAMPPSPRKRIRGWCAARPSKPTVPRASGGTAGSIPVRFRLVPDGCGVFAVLLPRGCHAALAIEQPHGLARHVRRQVRGAQHELTGKPLLISEFGFRAADPCLPNSFPPVYPPSRPRPIAPPRTTRTSPARAARRGSSAPTRSSRPIGRPPDASTARTTAGASSTRPTIRIGSWSSA